MPIQTLLDGHAKDLGGGLVVRRLLPSVPHQGVGPFVFFDHFGPMDVPAGVNQDVRPHPHIGLATVTFLFEGAMVHRDSLGVTQRIEPGAINWMTAGRGIVHSERVPEDLRDVPHRLHGLQLWVALPAEHEEAEPAFAHHPAETLPVWSGGGATVRVLVGATDRDGNRIASPVVPLGPTLYLDVQLAAGGHFDLDGEALEMGVYILEGGVSVDGDPVSAGEMGVLAGTRATITAEAPARFVVVGGDPLGERRVLWWNFVSSRVERVRAAAADWEAERFPTVPGETERIPLPDRPMP